MFAAGNAFRLGSVGASGDADMVGLQSVGVGSIVRLDLELVIRDEGGPGLDKVDAVLVPVVLISLVERPDFRASIIHEFREAEWNVSCVVVVRFAVVKRLID